MQTLYGKPVVERLGLLIKQEAAALIDAGVEPQLAVVMVGNNPDSSRYVAMKTKRAQELGIILSLYHLAEGTSYDEVRQTLEYLAKDEEVHGIIMQLPLPEPFTPVQVDELLALVPTSKDVDGLAGAWQTMAEEPVPFDIDQLLSRTGTFLPPMVSAVVSLLDHYALPFRDQKVVIVGKGRLVGAPLLAYFTKAGVDVQAVDEATDRILDTTSKADILITGTGERDLITYQWVKEGAVVIDCAQDLHRDSVEQVASAVTPEIGGVGPLTVNWLLFNLICAAQRKEADGR